MLENGARDETHVGCKTAIWLVDKRDGHGGEGHRCASFHPYGGFADNSCDGATGFFMAN